MKSMYEDSDGASVGFKKNEALRPFYITAVILSIIIVMKIYAYASSNSVSMLASLLDSLGDIVVSSFAFFSIIVSLKPPDKEHRYGHGKAEGFSALIQACFLFSSALFLIFENAHRFFVPAEIENHKIGILVSCLTMLLTLILTYFQNRAYRAAPSLVLKAEQSHYRGDVLLNAAVVVALVVDMTASFKYADFIISLGIALYIIKTAKDIGQNAVDMLMDREISEAERNQIIDIVTGHKDVHGLHDLRTRQSGMNIYISFDVELEPSLSLEKAHSITRDLDLQILAHFPNAEIIIHTDPLGDTYDPRHRVSGVHF